MTDNYSIIISSESKLFYVKSKTNLMPQTPTTRTGHDIVNDISCARPYVFMFIVYVTLEIKTFGLVLEFKMSFHQQQHSIAFMLLYSDLGGHWDIFFLPEVITQI